MRRQRKRRSVLDWVEWYELAVQYQREHGDLLIPRDYECPGGEKLGRWIERQRAKYNGVPSMTSQIEYWQIDALEEIGMVWKLENRWDWDFWLDKLDEYRQAHGDVDVPHAYQVDGCGLGDWLVKQRLYYAAGELTPKEIEDLEARGVRWQLRTRPRSWDDWFADAEAYYRQYGDLRVKLDYLTPDGGKLGYWIYKQRDIYMGRKKRPCLTPERVERLNSIGMVWDPMAARRSSASKSA